MLQQYRAYVLPFAILFGFLFHTFFEKCNIIVPYLLFLMLFISFCSVNFNEIRFRKIHFWLLLAQLGMTLLFYLLFLPFNSVLAQGAMMTLLAPTATAAVVVGGILGGNKATITAYSILCNIVVAFIAPIFFSIIGDTEISFFQSVYDILFKIIPLIIFPLLTALFLNYCLPKVYEFVKHSQNVAFYCWALVLTIVIGRTVNFVMLQDVSNYQIEILLMGISVILCVIQFAAGRFIGKKFGDTIAGGQLLGQKNVALSVWMTQTYLNPIASIAPASYSIWQNVFNSYQLWRKNRNDRKK